MSIRSAAFSVALALTIVTLPQPLPAQGNLPSRVYRKLPSTNAEGSVQVEATVNAEGEVYDVRVLSGPDELRKAALQSVLSSRFPTGDARRVTTMTIEFAKYAPRPSLPPAQAPPAIEETELEGVDYQGLSPELHQQAAGILVSLRAGQHLNNDLLSQYRQQLAAIDPVLELNVNTMRRGPSAPAVLRLLVSRRPAVPAGAIRVGSNVQQANLLQHVEPVYPPLARQARIQGVVKFTVIIGKDGLMQQIKVDSGHPLLIPAAQEAVKQYKYRPTLLNGQPVEVQTTVDVAFTL